MFVSRVAATLGMVSVGISAAVAAPVCTTGELFAGAPDYAEPAERAKNGQGLLDVPPLGFRALVFDGDKLVTAVGPEIWYSDLSAEKPVVKRITGRESNARDSVSGKCRDARMVNISGIAMLPHGSIAGADQAANTIFVVSDPYGPDCKVTFLAGAVQPQLPLANAQPTNIGDADGVGGEVLMRGPDWVAATDDGTIYFIDSGNGKLKKVLPQAPRAVETVLTLPDITYYALTLMDGKLYAIGNNDMSDGILVEIDLATAEATEIVNGRSDRWLSDGSINVSGLATDGEGLFTVQSGQLLYVTKDGDIESIAGNGTYFEPTADYDPRKPTKASDLEMWSRRRTQTAGANVFLAYRDGEVYFSAQGDTPYILKITCKP
ncbi:MAG: hypothetical protein QM698_02110 [Micropepsaceae bacterium]